MTTTRALAVAAYVAAVAAPATADWRAVADSLYAALPAVRGAVKPADASSATAPKWFADWKLGKVYSLDSLSVTFADGVAVRVNLAKATGKAPRIAAACRVAIAFYRARTGRDSVPAFASLVAASDGAAFDAAACSDLTADLRRTAHVPAAVRPAVTAEAVARMESELERRRAGLATAEAREAELLAARTESGRGPDTDRYKAACLAATRADQSGTTSTRWAEAISAGEAELAAMRAALAPSDPVAVPCEPVPSVAAVEPPQAVIEAPCDPVADMPDLAAAPVTVAACEPCEAVNDDGAPVPPMPGAPATAPAGIVPLGGTYVRLPDSGIEWRPDVPAHPGEAIGAAEAPEAIGEACGHIEPLAICPAVGLPCKPDCGFRPTCTASHTPPVEIAAVGAPVEIGEAIEAEPLHPVCSDDDVSVSAGPVTVLCLSHKAREAVLRRTDGRAVPAYDHAAKGGAFRLSLADARACADLRSVRFVGLPRKP